MQPLFWEDCLLGQACALWSLYTTPPRCVSEVQTLALEATTLSQAQGDCRQPNVIASGHDQTTGTLSSMETHMCHCQVTPLIHKARKLESNDHRYLPNTSREPLHRPIPTLTFGSRQMTDRQERTQGLARVPRTSVHSTQTHLERQVLDKYLHTRAHCPCSRSNLGAGATSIS